MIVKSTHFNVNTRVAKSHQMDKFKSIRMGEVVKRGLEIGDRAQKRLVGRHITANKHVGDPPVSMMALHEEFKQNERAHQPMKQLDMTKSCKNHDGTMQNTDFTRYAKRDILQG